MESCNQRSSDFGDREITASDEARFRAKVRRSAPDACWLWTASTWRNGYGQFRLGLPDGRQKTLGAHQAAWILSHGSIPNGSHVLHRCDVRRCCNPAHLFLGTHADNMRDAASKGRLSVPRPGRQKVTDQQCEEMVALRRSGLTLQAIGDRYGVSKVFVSRLMKGTLRQYRESVQQRRAS